MVVLVSVSSSASVLRAVVDVSVVDVDVDVLVDVDVDVLVDGEFKNDLKDTKLLWKGSSNQRVIDVQASLKQTDPVNPILHCGDYA